MKLTSLKIIQTFLFLFQPLLFVSCSQTPSMSFHKKTQKLNLYYSELSTNLFQLSAYSNQPLSKIKYAKTLHVYIGGDGTPWITPNHKSPDPTTRKSTTLRLMSLDSTASIYLGRPCYHKLNNNNKLCEDKWWTSHRYSNEVISSIQYAINQLSNNGQKLTLIGFSGGGAIAMLAANKLHQLRQIITISANLDINHWTNQHNFTPLYGSLNPIDQNDLPLTIAILHLLGEQDKNIDSDYLYRKFKDRKNTKIVLYPHYNHHCCWPEIWKNILDQHHRLN